MMPTSTMVTTIFGNKAQEQNHMDQNPKEEPN